MLLTVFYAASTWLQSWRLSSIKRRLLEMNNSKNSICIYKLPLFHETHSILESISTSKLSSSFCKNSYDANIFDLIWDNMGIRACSVFPKQLVCLDNWIQFDEEDLSFPITLPKSDVSHLLDPHIWLLLEAVCLDLELNSIPRDVLSYRVKKLGRPVAWRASGHFGLILESDANHLAELAAAFTCASMLLIDDGFAVDRIQTVDVEGKPCMVLNTDRIPVVRSPAKCLELPLSATWPRRPSLHMSPLQWKSHVELLRSFSTCADHAALGKTVSVPLHSSIIIAKSSESLSLHSPTIIDIPEDDLINAPKKDSLSPYETSSNVTEDFLTASFVNDSMQSTPNHSFLGKKSAFRSIGSRGSLASISSFGSVSTLRSAKLKPPNVLVYSESPVTTENVRAILSETLHKHKYTVYSISGDQLINSTWAVNCSLLVICGNVPDPAEPILIDFLVTGGKLLCLCSAFLHTLLPTFRTAEVRERELVRFSYGKWNRVRLMHHVFCYQNSPARTKFSREADEPPSEKDRLSPVPQTPPTIQIQDCEGKNHTLHVQVLGTEETWQTPSLILASLASPAGRAVFSQVHLELDPSEIVEEREGEALRSSDKARREIIRDLLRSHLGMECSDKEGNKHTYATAYFLGRHDLKLEFLDRMKLRQKDEALTVKDMKIRFYGKGETPGPASLDFLPVLIHACPRDFSTLEYFDTLETENLGRLLIYCDVLKSSMDILEVELAHGLAVVPSLQTAGRGRAGNLWLSPPGCAMFSLQVHLPLSSYLGRHPSIMQHVVAVAIVSALCDISSQYKNALELRLKWPNDIYTKEMVKIGGVLCTCNISDKLVVCNIGCGINLNNDAPTTCLNSMIEAFNKASSELGRIKKLTREKLLALSFNKLESLMKQMQKEDMDHFYSLYYEYWLHSGAEVHVVEPSGDSQLVTVAGIDDFGFLRVRENSGRIFTVQPDGNSFDMMDGLISPKLY